MKKMTIFMLIFALLLSLTGCGRQEAPAEEPSGPQGGQASQTIQAAAPSQKEPAVQQPQPLPELLSEDGAVHLTVERNRPFTQQAEEALKERDWLKAKVESILVDDIPALIAYKEDAASKPIMMVIHAGGGCKEDMIWSVYMADNYDAIWVTFDVGAYGESQRPARTDGESVVEAIRDIDKLLAYCSTIPGADMSRIYIEGSSMGASAVFAYLGYGSYRPALVSAGLATADFTTAQPGVSPLYLRHGGKESDPSLPEETLRALLEMYSPHKQPEHMMDSYILAGMGLQDTIADTPSCQALERKFLELGKTNFDFRYYDIGHEILPDDYSEARNALLDQFHEGKLQVQNHIFPAVVNGQLFGQLPEAPGQAPAAQPQQIIAPAGGAEAKTSAP